MDLGITRKQVEVLNFNKTKLISIYSKYKYYIFAVICIVVEKLIFILANKYYNIQINYIIQILDALTSVLITICVIASAKIKKNESEKKLIQMAYHDQLTGLHNRVSLLRYFKTLNINNKRDIGAIFFLDLDGFKGVNDKLGHDIGDELLKSISKKLEASVRKNDLVCRYGGDEFVIVFSQVKDKNSILRIADKIISIFKSTFSINGYEIKVTTSIGISIFPLDGEKLEILLKRSDEAMYLAKKEGKNRYKIYGYN